MLLLSFLVHHALSCNITHKDVIMEKYPFEFLNILRGSKMYNKVEELNRVVEYLDQFDYLDTLNANNNDVFNE